MQLGAIHLADRISDCLPYLKGALVSYKAWRHSTTTGFSVKEAQTGIITRVSYNGEMSHIIQIICSCKRYILPGQIVAIHGALPGDLDPFRARDD